MAAAKKKSTGSSRSNKSANNTLTVIILIVVIGLGALYALTGKDLLGIFSPGEEPPPAGVTAESPAPQPQAPPTVQMRPATGGRSILRTRSTSITRITGKILSKPA
jgi:hypothetical protein